MNNCQLTLVAPSRAVVIREATDRVDVSRIEKARAALQRMGWNVHEADNTRQNMKRFAGEDRERARCLEQALTTQETNFALMLRGGYGAMRLLPLLDWKAIAESHVPFMGLSDATAFNLALLTKTGCASWQGPSGAMFAEPNAQRDAAFIRAFSSHEYTFESEVNCADCDAEGILWGGNLAVLLSLLGTPYFPRIRGGILLLEDVAEPAFRIERMLLQLFHAGVLTAQSAVLLGDFSGADRGCGEGDGRFLLADALEHVEAVSGIRFIRGIPFGHIASCISVPIGVRSRLMVRSGRLRLLAPEVPVPRFTPWLES